MKLFEVTRWGNDMDGGNGPDTNYLVCARNHEEAAALVCERERNLDLITEFGVCSGKVERPVVLRGPYIQHSLSFGTHFPSWMWDRNGLDVWMPTAWCLDGEAISHYTNGQIAARCNYRNGCQHGLSVSWYPNGQLLHRAEHRHGKMVGLHEYWYADGTLASRYKYTGRGVRYQKWDRAGGLVAEGDEDWDCKDAEPEAAADGGA